MTSFIETERYLVELVEGEGNWCDSLSEEEDEIDDSEESDDSDYTTETDDDTEPDITDLIVSDNEIDDLIEDIIINNICELGYEYRIKQ